MKQIAWSVFAEEVCVSTVSEIVPVASLKFTVIAETKDQATMLAKAEIRSRGVNAVSIHLSAGGYSVP